MSQFSLYWNNGEVVGNSNAISQRASYRRRSVGGAWITAGFTPANDMAKAVATTDSPSGLADNAVYEFKVQTICTLSGPTENDNGIQEMIGFVCLTPTLTNTYNSSQMSLALAGTDITKVRFTLRRSSDNVVMASGTLINLAGTVATTIEDLASSTSYYWQLELYANLKTVEVVSSGVSFLNTLCGPYPFTTPTAPVCDPITAITVTSIAL